MSEVQHCESCRTEYVAGIPGCGDCGGPLRPGPLPDPPPNARTPAQAPTSPAANPDTKLVELPGLQADFAVRSLTMEGIVCGLECQGIRKVRLPDDPPGEPLAVTLPVSIFVPSDRLADAQSILKSLEPDDLIGAQWEAAPEPEAEDEDLPACDIPEPVPMEEREETPLPMADSPRGEGTTMRLLLFLVIGVAVVYALSR